MDSDRPINLYKITLKGSCKRKATDRNYKVVLAAGYDMMHAYIGLVEWLKEHDIGNEDQRKYASIEPFATGVGGANIHTEQAGNTKPVFAGTFHVPRVDEYYKLKNERE